MAKNEKGGAKKVPKRGEWDRKEEEEEFESFPGPSQLLSQDFIYINTVEGLMFLGCSGYWCLRFLSPLPLFNLRTGLL